MLDTVKNEKKNVNENEHVIEDILHDFTIMAV